MKRFLSALILLCVTSAVHAQPAPNAPALDWAKKKCIDLGFKAGTERFGSCVLQLSRDEEKDAHSNIGEQNRVVGQVRGADTTQTAPKGPVVSE
jgi:hypothetical protein